MELMAYLNGSLVPLSQARISPMDYGFLYGYGLFETMRAYGGRVCLLDKHLARLEHSAGTLGIDLEDPARMEKAIYGTLRANRLSNARVRLTVSPGEEGPVPGGPVRGEPTVFITAIDYQPPSDDIYRRGFSATFSMVHRSPKCHSSGMKSLSALDLLLARQEAACFNVDHAILLNDDDLVAEGSSTNIFYVKDGRLFTPAEHCGILPGVTRAAVLRELAPSLGVVTEELDVAVADLLEADEAFLTNSMIEIMPLTIVAGRDIGPGRPGALTGRLMQAYKAMVARSVGACGGTGTP
jgi:branched-subunit amino acid aminotransferase/4-amino-4-deoxychorismate lyase